MSRWREIKQKKDSQNTQAQEQDAQHYAAYVQRIKAFIVDMFMIYVPILYVLTYLVLGGKDEFQDSFAAPLVAWTLYGLIYAALLAKKGQTPGKKAYDLEVVNDDGTHLSFIKAFVRYLLFLFSAAIIVGVLLPLVRKDKKALHDLVLGTKEIDISA